MLKTDATIAPLMRLGAGTSATAHMIHSAPARHSDQGFKEVHQIWRRMQHRNAPWVINGRFYYADERKEDGTPAYMSISGEALANHCMEFAEGKAQDPWHQTLVGSYRYRQL
jgi:hypothetical protein